MTTKATKRKQDKVASIGTYSGVPMTCTLIKCTDGMGKETGEVQEIWGEEIPPSRDLTSNEFFAMVMAIVKQPWPEELSLRITRLDHFRDQAELIRSEGAKLIPICWTTYFRSFNRRYVNGLTLEVAKTVPLAIDQVGSDIADSVKVIAEGIQKFVLNAETAESAEKELVDAEAA